MSALPLRSSASPRVRVLLAATLVGLVAGPIPGTATASTAPASASAKPRYVSLGSVGLRVRSAHLKSRTLRVKVTANRRLALRFAIVRGTKQLGSAKISVRKGTTSLKLLLNQKSTGKNLRLRVTARTRGTRGRQRVGVQLLKLPVVVPKPKPKPITPPAAGQGGLPTPGPATPPPPANQAPTALALTNASVDENALANSTVGNLAGTDPDPADTLTYAFASGAGDADNASFVLDSGTLRTAAPFDFEAKSSYSVRLAVSDGRGGVLAQPFTITVIDVNETPTDLVLAGTSFAENSGANALVGSLSTVDPDAGDTATYSLVSGTGDTDNAAFTVSGSALRTAADPDFETKNSYSVRLRTTDSGGLTREEAFTVTVTDVDDAPVLTGSGGALTYTENDPPSVVDGGLTAADQDDANLEGATVAITAGHQTDDVLGFTGQSGITGSYAAATGVLVLSGSATVAAYQTALRSITFEHAGDDPVTAKTVSFTVGDGDLDSNTVTRGVAITAVNDAPVLTTTVADLAYPELAGAVAVDPGVVAADPDSAQLTGATVQITGNLNAAQDVLAYTDMLGITGSYSPGTGVLTLSGAASVADYQAALRTVTYANSSANPSPLTRTVTFAATDPGGTTSMSATRGITIGAANDAATVSTTGGALAYAENGAPLAVDDGLTVNDPDDTDLEGARVVLTAGLDAGDVLGFTDTAAITGAYDATTGVLALTGTATPAAYEAALRSVTFSSTSDTPTTTKTLTFRADDGDGLGPAGARTIDVTPINDEPVLTTTAGTLSYTEGDGPVAIDGALALTDPDSTMISGATVEISANFAPGQDVLALPLGSGLTASYVGDTLTMTGLATLAVYRDALRSVTYANTSEGPSTLTRSVTFSVTDSPDGGTGSASRAITVATVNDPPAAVDDSGTTDEDTPLVVASPGVLANDTDPDPGDTKTVVELNGGTTLTGATTENGTVTIGASGGYTYTPPAAFQGLSDGEGDTDSFIYTVEDGAGAQSTATVTITVTGVSDAPVAVGDSFDAVGNTGLFVGTVKGSVAGREISGSVLANDTDPDTPAASLVTTPETKATTLGGTVTIRADGSFTYHPDDGAVDVTDTFSYTVSDGVASASGTVDIPLADQVWYVDNSAAAGGDGTSDGPFDTLAEAETASGAGDTTYVLDGDDTTADLDTGFVLDANARLLGERATLQIGADVLRAADAVKRPALTATNEDVVVLASGSTVRGISVDPAGTGGGVSGGTGVSAATIDDVVIVDTGTLGTQPGLELDGTTGTTDVSDLTVSTSGATGVRVTDAGTVVFAASGTISIATTGARALDATMTDLGGSVVDDITVSGSPAGGVSLVSTGGTPTLGDGIGVDIALATTSGATPALVLDAATGLTLGAGTRTVTATGGPAVHARNVTGLLLDLQTVSSTNSAGDGIDLDTIGTSRFTATGGSITGAAGIAFDLNGGSNTVTYPGSIGDGTGATAEITGRTGGSVTLSGAITDGPDVGGGISLSGNSAGSTTFSAATKTLSTGASTAVAVTGNGGHSVAFSGGGLDIDTTTGAGLTATGGGTLAVSGTGNTIDRTSSGPAALRVASTTIGAGGLTFQRISSNGGPNGIVLDTTGSSGGLTVTGTGTAGSGGTIQNTTGGDSSSVTPEGAGVVLRNTQAPSLTSVTITNHGNYGIRGDDVRGLTLSGVTVNGTNGTNDASPFNDASARFTNLTGAASITSSTFSGGFADNLAVVNTSGSLNRLTMTGTTIGLNSTVGGNDGVRLETLAGAGQLRATFTDNTFSGARGDLLQYSHNGSGTGDLVLTGNAFSNNHPAIATGGGGVSLFQGGSSGGDTTMTIDGNTFRDSVGHAVLVVNATGPTNQTGSFTNNRIGVSGLANSGSLEGSGLRIQNVDTGTTTWTVTGNEIRQYNFSGLDVLAGGGAAATAGTVNASVTGNTIEQPGTNAALTLARRGMEFNIGTTPGDTFQACAVITGNSVATGGTDDAGAGDIRLRQRQSTTFRLPGYVGPADNSGNQVNAFVAANNAGATVSTSVSSPPGGGFLGTGTTCP